ncbi:MULTISPECIES: hypothetical protein [unclassified Sinorhizobium]|uniref:hypothetical protein n=1 Tax=unclassified Sinorhizobium TaxID=2613772 RepID=UPI00352511B8
MPEHSPFPGSAVAEVDRFQCEDVESKLFMVVEFRAAATGGTGAPAVTNYRTSDGWPVRALKDGTFQIAKTGEILHRL